MTDPVRYDFVEPKPYSHQLRALNKINKLDGKAGLWMPMRTGKTRTTIDWAGIAYHNHGLRRVVIVCPISVIDVWAEEIKKWSPVPSHITLLRMTAKENAYAVKSWLDDDDLPDVPMVHWAIINYEMLWRPIVRKGEPGYVNRKAKTLDEIIADWKPDLVVADEAHKIKSHTSKQSEALARLGKASRMRLGLTGTPITKAPLDLYGIFRFVDPDTFEQKKWKCYKRGDKLDPHVHDTSCEGFADHYAEWAPSRFDPRVQEVQHYKNVAELAERTRAHSFKVKLSDCFDVPADLPDTIIKVHLNKAARKAYDEMAKEMITFLEDGRAVTADIILTKLVRLSQITSGFVKDEEGIEVGIDTAKLDALKDLVSNVVEQDEKLVVFCRFIHDYERISEMLEQAKIKHAMLTGKTKPRDRTDNIKSFRSPSVPVFVSQIQSGSLGIDLSSARLAAFYSLDYNWATYVQARQRILDVNNLRPLGYYHLVVPNSIDVVQMRVLRERGNMADALIHNPRSLLDRDDFHLPQ